ncbi:MAG: hypothetical protein U7123_06640 [Potamolinea sp.]
MFLTTNGKISMLDDSVFYSISKPKIELDPYAIKALSATEKYLKDEFKTDPKQKLIQRGLTEQIANLSARLESSGLDDTHRLLLSSPDIYAVLINTALDVSKVQTDDLEGLYNAILRAVGDKPKRLFLAWMLTQVIDAHSIRVQPDDEKWQRIDDLTLERGIPIRNGQVEPAVMALLDTLNKEGNIPFYVGQYIKRGEINSTAFTPAIKQSMINYLIKIGLQITSEIDFKAGKYDEYFALAYNEALKISTAAEDPIDQARTKGSETTWDFTVDIFDAVQEQAVIPANIRAAGALDYIYYIGERLQVFNVANALVLRWASASLDIPDGKTAAALYRFHKLRSDRSTPEERAMLYKRVLNRGNGKLLSNMVVNEPFSGFWNTLMSEVAEYIRKSENNKSSDNNVSRTQLYQATKNLQYNLTEHMTGMAHLQVTEDYAHLQEALAILKFDDILNHFGGRRKSIWNVIETVAKQDLGIAVPSSAIRTIAIEGNKVFQWIAKFNEGMVKENEFKALLDAGEAWIIAQASLDSDDESPYTEKTKEKEKKQVASHGKNNRKDDEESDDFDDWEV